MANPISTAPLSDIYETGGRGMRELLLWLPKGGDKKEGCWAFCYVTESGPKARGYNGDWEITHWAEIPAPPAKDSAHA